MGTSTTSSNAGVVVFVIIVLAALGIWVLYAKGFIDLTDLEVSASKKDMVCSNALDWPTELKKSNPMNRMKAYCKRGVLNLNWGKTSKNCTAYLGASASLECSEATFSRRRRAARVRRLAGVKRWEAEIKRDVLSNSNLEILTTGDAVEVLRTIGKRLTDTRKHPLFKDDFEYYLYDVSGNLEELEDNAFAIPGGSIFMSRSLFRQLGEAELAFVLGHEIAHVEWSSFSSEILSLIDKSILSRIKGVLLNVCEGPMDEVVADRYALRYMAKAGYDVSAPTRLFWGLFRDGGDLSEFSVLDSHPPSSMRASFVFMEARKHLKPAHPMFRGNADQTALWDGTFSQADKARCESQTSLSR